MTPTDEETELARVIERVETADWALGTTSIVEATKHYRVRLARAILADGYRKQDPATIRNQALEAAAKSCDALVHEASANRAAESTNYDFWQGAAVGAEESAARIRALKT